MSRRRCATWCGPCYDQARYLRHLGSGGELVGGVGEVPWSPGTAERGLAVDVDPLPTGPAEGQGGPAQAFDTEPDHARLVALDPVAPHLADIDAAGADRDETMAAGILPRGAPVWAGSGLVWLAGAVVLFVVTLLGHLSAYRLTTRNVYRASPTVTRM